MTTYPTPTTDTPTFNTWLGFYTPGTRLSANDAIDWADAAQVHPRRLGNLFLGAAAAGYIEAADCRGVPSIRPSRKGGRDAVWVRTRKAIP